MLRPLDSPTGCNPVNGARNVHHTPSQDCNYPQIEVAHSQGVRCDIRLIKYKFYAPRQSEVLRFVTRRVSRAILFNKRTFTKSFCPKLQLYRSLKAFHQSDCNLNSHATTSSNLEFCSNVTPVSSRLFAEIQKLRLDIEGTLHP